MTGQKMFETLKQALDKMEWKYTPEDDKLIIRTSAVGDDLSMKLFMRVDADRSVMYLKSPMPFPIPEERRSEVAMAVLIANYAMLNGSFEMDLSDGYLAFKVVVPFMESIISDEVCRYMIRLSCNMVDTFNDKFEALVKGEMTLREFKEFTDKEFN